MARPDLQPVRTHRHLGAQAGVAGGSHTEGAGGGFRVQELLQHTLLNQGETVHRSAFPIEAGGADVAGVEAVVVDREERHRQLVTERLAMAEAHPIQHRSGVEQAAEGPDQIKKSLRAEQAGVMAGVDRGVVEVGDGALGGFVDAAGHVEQGGAVGQPDGTTAAGFAARFLGPGIEIKAGGAQPLLTAGTIAVEVDPLAAALGQAVVGNRADRGVAREQIPLGVLERGQQAEDAHRLHQRLVEAFERCGGKRRKRRGVVGIAVGAGFLGAGQGAGQACRREIGGAGDPHQAIPVPDPHGDRAALGALELLRLAPVHLNRGVGAAGGAEIPALDAQFGGEPLELAGQLGGIQALHGRFTDG